MDERIDVIFTDVVIYHFEGDNFKTVIFDIYEVELEAIYDQHEKLFQQMKNYGWLDFGYKTKDKLIGRMNSEKTKGFIIHSSFGLSGWIWARKMEKLKVAF